MSDQTPERPISSDDRDGWKAYWAAQGMLWRTEPEIDEERQAFLTERRAVRPEIEQGIYSFRDENGGIKLGRADVEWLLATHESNGMVGPVDWHDGKQRGRHGVDLRAADVSGVDLRGLPLARTIAGLDADERAGRSPQERSDASIRAEHADFSFAHLEGARFSWASLRGTNLYLAKGQRAHFNFVHFEGANLRDATLAGATIRNASFDASSYLTGLVLGDRENGVVALAGVRWNGADLGAVDWASLTVTGDEQRAHDESKMGRKRDRAQAIKEYSVAVRASRQLGTALRNQGLNEHADRFAYRAQMLNRRVLWRQGRFARYFGSWLLDLLSGYGYQPLRSLIAYIVIICLFAGAYLLNAQFAAPHLTWDESLVLSISSFHGRGFFTSGISLGDTLARLAAGEAIIGLLIEITFIATFTQRFFAR